MEKPEVDMQVERPLPDDQHPSIGHNINEIHGRAIQQQEHQRGYLETLRKDPWLLFWMGVMLWTLGVRGFESQSSSSVISIPYFKKRFGTLQDGEYFIETKWQSALNGGGNAAAIVGAWAGSYFADMVGIKPVVRE
jgi:hypothetical protein